MKIASWCTPYEGESYLARVALRGEKIPAPKARAVLVGGDLYDLSSELWIAHKGVQYIVDALWKLELTTLERLRI